MEIKKCLIIDNGDVSQSSYFLLLRKLSFVECEICSTTDEGLKFIFSKRGVDLIIINTCLDTDTLSDFFKQMYVSPPVIVISESDKLARQAFDMDNVVDIILLPFDKNRLLRALSKAWGIRHSENSVSDLNSVFLKCGRIIRRFSFDRIEYVEAYGIYSKLYYEGTKVIINENISSLEHLLDKRKFRRVHKSYIININNIQEIDSRGILLENKKERVPFGPKYRPLVANLFKLHSSENS
jgi:DNA-binding LytR/AlgR family response regulator